MSRLTVAQICRNILSHTQRNIPTGVLEGALVAYTRIESWTQEF